MGSSKRDSPAPQGTNQLAEGVDYYLDGGLLVLTESYLLRRGYCCNSRCRHCPYGERAPTSRVALVGLPEEET